MWDGLWVVYKGVILWGVRLSGLDRRLGLTYPQTYKYNTTQHNTGVRVGHARGARAGGPGGGAGACVCDFVCGGGRVWVENYYVLDRTAFVFVGGAPDRGDWTHAHTHTITRRWWWRSRSSASSRSRWARRPRYIQRDARSMVDVGDFGSWLGM